MKPVVKKIFCWSAGIIILSGYSFFRFYFGKNLDLLILKNDIISLDALVGVLIGSGLAYWFNLRQGQKVIDQEAKTYSRYTFVVLFKQFSILKGIEDHFFTEAIKNFCEDRVNALPDNRLQVQKFAITNLSFSLDQDILNKILLSTDFEKSNNVLEVMQYLISAEDSFRKCVKLIELFNENVDLIINSHFSKISRSAMPNLEVIQKVEKEVAELLKTVYKAHKDATSINELATKHFSIICKQSFKNFKCPKRGEVIELIKLT